MELVPSADPAVVPFLHHPSRRPVRGQAGGVDRHGDGDGPGRCPGPVGHHPGVGDVRCPGQDAEPPGALVELGVRDPPQTQALHAPGDPSGDGPVAQVASGDLVHPPFDDDVGDAEGRTDLGVVGGVERRQHLLARQEFVEGVLEGALRIVVHSPIPFTLPRLHRHGGHRVWPSVPTPRQAVGAAGSGRFFIVHLFGADFHRFWSLNYNQPALLVDIYSKRKNFAKHPRTF